MKLELFNARFRWEGVIRVNIHIKICEVMNRWQSWTEKEGQTQKEWGLVAALGCAERLLQETCSQPNYPPVSHFLKRELLQIRPVVGGYIAFRAMEI